MSNIDEHALRRNLLAAHLFFDRVEKLVNLYREGAGLGLALAFSGSLDAQLGKIVAAYSVRQDDIDHGLAEGAVCHGQLDVHFGFAAKLGHAYAKSAPVDPDSLA